MTIFPPSSDTTPLAAELGVHPLVAELLARRGLHTTAAARGFLDPAYYRPQLPEALPGVRRAAALLGQALAAGWRILVWGDFDVDGQTATSVLVQAFEDLAEGSGAAIDYHVPVRAVEGHGISLGVLSGYFEGEQSPQLIITCDTGVTAFDAVEFAHSHGAQVVITDHHELLLDADGAPRLPPAEAVVSPRLLPAGHPLAGLPGVGVVYKLIEALYEAAGRPQDAEAYLDLAALGIVADVAEQTGDTRYLLQLGLQRLRRTTRPGLLALYERAALKAETITEEQVGVARGPRLNALGRLGDANPAVELLTTADMGRARMLALQLEGLNARRQLLTSQTLQSALKQLEADPALLDGAALLLANPHWEPGIIGIVAGRLAERFARPVALVAAPPGAPARGSARSVPGIHITAALAANAALLRSFGGHAGAAGFAVEAESVPALRRGLNRAVAAQQAQRRQDEASTGQGAQVFSVPLQPGEAARVDAVLEWQDIGLPLAQELERLAPFGPGNPAPALACSQVAVTGMAAVGRANEHLALRLTGPDGATQRAMWWGGADFAARFPLPEGPLEAVITLRIAAAGAAPLQVEWLGYRLPAVAPEALPTLALRDYRFEAHPLGALTALLDDPAGVFIWAEGESRQALAGHVPEAAIGGRDQIQPCGLLVVWTRPPGPAELAAALRASGAAQAALFSVDAGMDAAQVFLERLAGAARAVLRRQSLAEESATGEPLAGVPLARLAAVTSQRETAVRLGLAWLQAQGHLQARLQDGQVFLLPGSLAEKDEARAAEVLARLRQLLSETHAFRRFYAQSSLAALQTGLAEPAEPPSPAGGRPATRQA